MAGRVTQGKKRKAATSVSGYTSALPALSRRQSVFLLPDNSVERWKRTSFFYFICGPFFSMTKLLICVSVAYNLSFIAVIIKHPLISSQTRPLLLHWYNIATLVQINILAGLFHYLGEAVTDTRFSKYMCVSDSSDDFLL